MSHKVKDTCSKFSSDERVQTEALNTAQEEVGEHNLTGTPDSKKNMRNRSLSKEKLDQISTSPQQTQGPSTERSSVSEDKEKVPENAGEKVASVKSAVNFDESEVTKTQLSQTDISEKAVEKKLETTSKPSSPPSLKWSNKPVPQAKGKKKKVKKKEDKQSRQTEVPEYFAVRRSSRKNKSVIQSEKQKALEEAVLSGKEQNLEVQEVEGKGRGVFAKQDFSRGQFVCEYAGELISYEAAKEREKFYEGKTEFGCYMYYFTFKNNKFCIDATKESDRLGRLLNHSRTDANCATRLVSIKDKPYLILETIRDVKAGQELLYDYGERSKDVLQYHQWLKS